MVKLLLEMKVGLDTVMNEAFGKDERFGHALKDAFEHFVNQRANRYLACSQLPGNVTDTRKKAWAMDSEGSKKVKHQHE